MKTFFALITTATLALVGAVTATEDGNAVQRALVRDLEQAIAAPGWNADRWGVLVISLESGDTLFAHQPHEALVPASNMKLFTTAAALRYLGPGYRYGTYLVATGPVVEGVLRGDLLVYGTGDPTNSRRFFEARTGVWEALADSLRALGIERIEGDLVGDASYFEGPGIGEGWAMGYATHSYAAPASALSFNDNVATLHVTPGANVGAPASIQVIPAGEIHLVNEARTVGSGRSRIAVERDSYDAPIRVTGQIQRTQRSGQWRAVPVVDPARFSVTALRDVLAQRGVQVFGRIRSVQDASASAIGSRRVFAPAFQEGPPVQVLAVHRSPPLLEILKVVNQRSHNMYAESVLRTIGRVVTGRGSMEAGSEAVAALLDEAGIEASEVRVADGSGLSGLNRATAAAIVQVLAYMDSSPYGDAYRETLPEAAVSRGLRRMQRTDAAGNLRAKTGTIDRVSALSGYVRSRTGERLAFSIISNDVPSTWTAKRVEDRIGARLAALDRPIPGPAPVLAAAEDTTAAPDTVVVAAADATDAAESGTAGQQAEAAATVMASADPGGEEGELADAAVDAPVETERFYTIRRGDTLDGIARRHGFALATLRDANPEVNPRRLMPGDRIRLPADG